MRRIGKTTLLVAIGLLLSSANSLPAAEAEPLDQRSADLLSIEAPENLVVRSTEMVSFLDNLAVDVCSSTDACGCGEGVKCGSGVGCCKKKAKPNPCATSHQLLFYNNDFSYLNKSAYQGHCLGDCLKLMPVGECGQLGTLDVGGQLRVRLHSERGMAQDLAGVGTRRFQDTQHEFALTRLRLYSNWKVNEKIRFYGEGIFSEASDDGGTYRPRAIDRNYGDFLNLFVDVKLNDSTTVRVGRQELFYGAQRVVSPLDWSNTRRRFEGAKVMWKQGNWGIDSFYTHFVPVDPNDLDEADYDQSFYGAYATYSGWENSSMDVYYLGYDNENPGPVTGDFSLHTIGMRLHGSVDGWLYDMEGGPQFGRQSGLGLDHEAMFATAGLGRKMVDNAWEPTVWFYYDYASGNNAGDDFNRLNHLFPLAHRYLGFIDAVQRSNIEAPNVLVTMAPTKKVKLLFWYWHFMSNQDSDIVPSLGGTPTQSTASKDFGDELDILVKYGFNPRSNVLFGWSHFWRGNKIVGTNDADFFYTQWTMNF